MNLLIRDGIVFVFYLRKKKNHRQKNTSLLAHYLSATINNTNLVSHTHSCGSIFILFRQTLVNHVFHDDVIKWEHFPRYWRYRPPMNSPLKGQWRVALMFSLICTWITGWVNNREAGDLRRHRAHYDVTVMFCNDILQGCFTCNCIFLHQTTMEHIKTRTVPTVFPMHMYVRWHK